VTIAEAADRVSSGRFKTLIVGAGIAGMALAALLER
jgi:cation diffusion facilitator CzcD-associated flavoprotein CzcO